MAFRERWGGWGPRASKGGAGKIASRTGLTDALPPRRAAFASKPGPVRSASPSPSPRGPPTLCTATGGGCSSPPRPWRPAPRPRELIRFSTSPTSPPMRSRASLPMRRAAAQGGAGSSRSMAGPAPDDLPVPDDLPNAMKGYPPHSAKVIRDLEHLPFSGREGDLPKGHPLEGMVVAILIANLETTFAELVVPPYSVQQLMNGQHRVAGDREAWRSRAFKAPAEAGPLRNVVGYTEARQEVRGTGAGRS
jgi:hypothetical protein